MRNRTEREVYNRNAYERELQRERDIARSNTAAANGLLIGILIVAVAGAIAAFYAINRNTRPAETQIITPPTVNVEPPAAVEPPDVNITAPVIEPPAVEVPDVNITTPDTTAPQAAPEATAPEAPAPVEPSPETAPQQ